MQKKKPIRPGGSGAGLHLQTSAWLGYEDYRPKRVRHLYASIGAATIHNKHLSFSSNL
jgi:hypothetical protein